MKKREDIRIRDPFIYVDCEAGCYYMYGTSDFEAPDSGKSERRFTVYKSYDLESFDDGKVIFDGEFEPISDAPVTPADWECLDGTLFIDGGVPYLVFSHEWTQIKNGTICAVELSSDLTRAVGEVHTLFAASDNPAVTELRRGSGNYVTDGPFLYREDGKIKMIWSSFERGRYLVIGAYADTLLGEWTHTPSVFDFNGGHAMIFENLEGERVMSLHSPNHTGLERAVFHKI